MGVPKFAPWVTRKYPEMVSTTCPQNAHGLYIDLNGLIHPCCHSDHNLSVALRPEEEKMRAICYEIEKLVATVQPETVLYIATDGVAPRAKMNQQRARRYMSAAEHNAGTTIVEEVTKDVLPQDLSTTSLELDIVREDLMQDALYGGAFGENKDNSDASKKGEGNDFFSSDIFGNQGIDKGEELDRGDILQENELFDSNCITPGTVFMSKVSDAVRNMVEEKLLGDDPLWEKLHVIFSTSQTPGEGEQKIIDFIRTQSSYPGFNGKGSHVIVGLDADIIFLSLSLHIPHVVILRYQTRNFYSKKKAKSRTKLQKNVNKEIQTSHEKKEYSDCKTKKGDSGDDDDAKNEKDNDGIDETTENDFTNVSADDGDDANSPRCIVMTPTYDYYDVDVVGNSIVSELYLLSQVKGFAPKDANAFAPDRLISSCGYDFCRSSGLPEGKKSGGAGVFHGRDVKEGFHPCLSSSNSKVIDDFIVLGMLMGNDFLPRLPSAFCGDSAMDNLMEVYITDVLPYGYLTSDNYEIDLTQLRRLFSSYAKVEVSKFRQFAVLSNSIEPADAAAPLRAPVDECWRQSYLNSTGLAAHMDTACEKYIQGLRFVWRYYASTSSACSWSWFYPFHHAPFALDLADFLGRATPAMLQPPPLERTPPNAFVQLLCVLPPTSHLLLPAALGDAMIRPPPELRDTFPTAWQIDHAGAQGKDYLAVVMLPFANAEQLRELVEEMWPRLSKEEQQLAEQTDYHIVMRRAVEHANKSGGKVNTFRLSGGLHELGADDVPWTLRTGLTYEALRDSLPQRLCPKVYDSNAVIPRLSCSSNNKSDKNERRFSRARHKRRGRKTDKSTEVSGKAQEVGSSDGILCSVKEDTSFAEVLIAFSVISVLTACAVSPSAVLQVLALNLAAIVLTFFMGIAVRNPLVGSGICRNNVRLTYVDWLCPSCLSLNFARCNRCFICQEPFEARSLAVFKSSQPSTPPLMEPNHAPYIETVTLNLPAK